MLQDPHTSTDYFANNNNIELKTYHDMFKKNWDILYYTTCLTW